MKFSFHDLRPELRIAAVILAIWLFLFIEGRPPVIIEDLEFINQPLIPASLVKTKAVGHWIKQCPSDVFRTYKDQAGNALHHLPVRTGGVAAPSSEEQVNIYTHWFPEKPALANNWPEIVCFQAVIEHRCGLIDTVSVSPEACAPVAGIAVSDGPTWGDE